MTSKRQILLPSLPIVVNTAETDELRMRLFGDEDMPSPLPLSLSPGVWEDVEKVITPFSKGDNHCELTDDTPLESQTPQSRRGKRRVHSTNVKRSLFSGKRPAGHRDGDETFTAKRRRELSGSPASESRSTGIIHAVDRLSTQDELVADGSRDNRLPTIPGKHQDLRSISPDTMADVLTGRYDNEIPKMTVIDCRYPYEFQAGHIKGAMNLYTKDSVHQFLHDNMTSSGQHVLVFHCEFSSERGPKMYRFLRSLDRDVNKDHYPRLHFPEIYLLEGGYKAFFELHQDLCHPIAYKPMLHEDHTADLRHFRVKSKSWAAGEKQQKAKRRISRRSFEF